MRIGTLYGLGVGPGDPELITVKAFRKLQESPVIAYPKKLRGSKSYAHQIVDMYINPEEKEMLGLVFPMTKDEETLRAEWTKSAKAIYGFLSQGKDVAFVTEGDPMLFSTFIHLMKLMQKMHPDVPIETVAGISSFNGSVNRLGIALADGDDHVAMIPATENMEEMRRVIETHDAIVFIKVAKVLDDMLNLLDEMSLLDKTHVVTKVTSDEEVIWNVQELRGAELNYLSCMVVRK
ncbi:MULTISPECIES: precorrin-2 C(20)-methyltransferase [Bacillaceae]|uniref:Precorrin-2 C(20)-methyltransferase n=1 Tax=Cytobacillus firmus TaxID=1399 RepID=A0AA46SF16_CYTFI|nr:MULTISPECIES: precorrin-2 C(20)-methyltransferase [Bacillaceae]KML44501.1 precorrin-2 C20-methyltransferase [Cytobacillus firmus]MCS0653297.1 precorrin-2 C(20)-methyltransferase [Cytobacillus firmus]MCU1806257.1 precorrin-2 C(20)-methyltransferase [Cytobacillus firmus]URT68924.1 precorrin-2 C(20)-methyltransferase [Cytobacillus firmus]UYG95466.1 precorrin-2 C(20)-methyltransferase [Cytobacillus firmus]